MYNYVRHNLTAANDAMTHYGKIYKMDQDAATNARSQHKRYQKYFLDAIPGKRRGTEYEIQNFVYHLRKGCYRDPLPPEEMSYVIPQTGKDASSGTNKMPLLRRKRGTSGGESINKQVGRPGKMSVTYWWSLQIRGLLFIFFNSITTRMWSWSHY
jgi:hypothetical protein